MNSEVTFWITIVNYIILYKRRESINLQCVPAGNDVKRAAFKSNVIKISVFLLSVIITIFEIMRRI